MKNALLRGGLTLAMSCLTAGVLVAQERAQTQPPAYPDQPRMGDVRTVTATGCLKEEKDVPGGRPNVAEQAGLGEDFILTKATIAQSSTGSARSSQAPADPSSPSSPSSSSASTRTGQGAMFKIEGLDDELLRSHTNKQVEVQGRLLERIPLSPDASNPPAGEQQTAPDEVQAIRATSIKVIAGTCTTGTN